MATTTGTTGDDNLVGGSGDDILSGGDGSDSLNGGSGGDTLSGGTGSDSLDGGSGNDILDGGSGIDQLSGGQGADTLIFKAFENLSSFVNTTFSAYDAYAGGNGAAKQSIADVDTLQIWLNPAQLASTAIMLDIANAQAWVEAQKNANTGQAGNATFTFQTLNLQITQIESISIRNQFGFEDITSPTVVVNIVDPSLSDNNNSSVVTFTFSEVPVGFSSADITVSGGALSGLTQDLAGDPSGKTWTATFTATDNFNGAGSVTVTSGSYTDAAFNAGTGGNDSVAIDTVNPTVIVSLDDTAFSDSNNTGVVTFTFSEVPTGFDLTDVSVTGGSLSNLQPTADPLVFTADFLVNDNSTTSVSISVPANTFTDPVGNLNTVSNTDTATVDTVNPTVAVNIVDSSLNSSDTTSNVTFIFTEVPVGFSNADITASGGTLSPVTQDLGTDPTGKTWTAIFTATNGITATGYVTVNAGTYTDAAGNSGGSGSDTVSINTVSGDPNDFDGQVAGPNNSSTTGPDTLVGTSGIDGISGNSGDDTIYGLGGNDDLNGNGDDDFIYGGSGNDTISGNNGNDELYGGSGTDTVVGGNDSDVLIGGYEADTITTSNGTDVVRYWSVLDAGDTITDFSAANDTFEFRLPWSSPGFSGGFAMANQASAGTANSMVTTNATTTSIAGADVVRWSGSSSSMDTAAEVDALLMNSAGSFNGGVLVVAYNGGNAALYYDADANDAGGVTLIGTLTNLTNTTSFAAADFVFIA